MGDRLTERMACMAVFARVVDMGGFSAAARSLGLTKSAVSKQVARLETLCGAQLLRRTTRSISLTEAGQVMVERAREAVALCEGAGREIDSLHGDAAGTVRMSAPVTFGQRCIVPLLPELLAAHPRLDVQLVLLDRPVDLAQEGYDLAIRLTRSLPGDVVARRLLTTRYLLCAAAHAAPVLAHPRDLAGVVCLRYGEGEHARAWHFRRAGEEEAVAVRGNVAVNNSESLRALMLAGGGVALLPDYVVAEDVEAGRAVELLPGWEPRPVFGHQAFAIWLPHRYQPTRVRVVLDFLSDRLASFLSQK
ncbi:transcriptional regulator, LysR family [Massilia sp. PDC64]|nr:LysR family transcriptional regulator [Massilia sp. PDC64]SDF12335.1 transcriptional regulator, LysR family [Massilia sp. PDC64]